MHTLRDASFRLTMASAASDARPLMLKHLVAAVADKDACHVTAKLATALDNGINLARDFGSQYRNIRTPVFSTSASEQRSRENIADALHRT